MVVIALAIAFTRYPRSSRCDAGRPQLALRGVAQAARAVCVIAQFFYVGAQVGTWSLLVDFAKKPRTCPNA